MALHVQSSFSAGELDPVLRERTTFEKFQSGLAVARNMNIAVSGRIISRSARQVLVATKLSSSTSVIYSPPNTGIVLEFGHGYVRTYAIVYTPGLFTLTLTADNATSLAYTDLPFTHFETTGNFVYVFKTGKAIQTVNWTTGAVAAAFASTVAAQIPVAPTLTSLSAAATGTGYAVDYVATFIIKGEESLQSLPIISSVSGFALPITAAQVNLMQFGTPTVSGITSMNVYRRPSVGGAFGFVGSNSLGFTSGGTTQFQFNDYGGAADYTHAPPMLVTEGANILQAKTGTIYQQRLLATEPVTLNTEVILASRPGYLGDFYANTPVDSGSALSFLAGTSGTANVLRMVDYNGLVVFTGIGPYVNGGALTPTNLGFNQKGNWVIQDNLPTIKAPGGLLFIDSLTNSVRSFNWSLQLGTFSAENLSVYSNHLFLGRKVISWAFQSGQTPLVWVVFDDGTFGSLTYESDQKMIAWTRGDSEFFVSGVAGTNIPDQTLFLLSPGNPALVVTQQYISITVPRYVSGAVALLDSESDKNFSNVLMDEMVTYNGLMTPLLSGADKFVLTAVTPGVWDGPLTLTCGTSALFLNSNNTNGAPNYIVNSGLVGTIYRVFNLVDQSTIDLTITARASSNSVTVQPSCLFPSAQAGNVRLYAIANNIDNGMAHLNGFNLAIVADGYVVASPNNPDYPLVAAASGFFILPSTYPFAAIIHAGLPVTVDVQTLNIDTVEQRPILIESKVVNKVYTYIYNTRGLFVDNSLPTDGSIDGMQSMDSYDVDYTQTNPVVVNRYQAPRSKRIEMTLPGDWKTNGQIALRQVDPVPFEILSIIPDVEDERR